MRQSPTVIAWLFLLAACRDSGSSTRDLRPPPPSARSATSLISLSWPLPDDAPQLQAYDIADSLDIPQCREPPPIITPDSIGPLFINQTLDSLRRACRQLLYAWDWGAEAIPEPAVTLRLGRAVLVAILTDSSLNSTIQRISTMSPEAHTPSGAGPGMLIDSLVLLYGTPQFDAYECGLQASFRSAPHLGFELTLPTDSSLDCNIPAAGTLPKGSRVWRVWLVRASAG